jgi:hypothetical protein
MTAHKEFALLCLENPLLGKSELGEHVNWWSEARASSQLPLLARRGSCAGPSIWEANVLLCSVPPRCSGESCCQIELR